MPSPSCRSCAIPPPATAELQLDAVPGGGLRAVSTRRPIRPTWRPSPTPRAPRSRGASSRGRPTFSFEDWQQAAWDTTVLEAQRRHPRADRAVATPARRRAGRAPDGWPSRSPSSKPGTRGGERRLRRDDGLRRVDGAPARARDGEHAAASKAAAAAGGGGGAGAAAPAASRWPLVVALEDAVAGPHRRPRRLAHRLG
jgi:hypothetical protein